MSTAARIDELRNRFLDNPRRYFASYANELRRAGALDEAIALCRDYLPQVPGHMSGQIVFGQALFEADQLADARTVFEQALALDPENLIALRHLGDIDRRLGDPAAARRWYERVLEADPRNDDIAAQLATLSAPVAPPAVMAPGPTWAREEPESGDAGPPPWAAAVDATDPFAFGGRTMPSADVTEAHMDGDEAAAFEEGLVAPEWPDTSDLADRAATPRRSEAVPSPATALDASLFDAFGGSPTRNTPIADRSSVDLPAWMRTPTAPAEPVESSERVVSPVVEHAVDAPAEISPVSFADVHPDLPVIPVATPVATPAAVTSITETPVGTPAFVTATMGELFVSQGFLDRAVSVYEELVRQRPDDPGLQQRLSELRAQIAAPAPRAPGYRTARERFSALAARRVGVPTSSTGIRRDAAVISVANDLSLDALFGSGGSAEDLRAAQVIADAFKPVSEPSTDFVREIDRLPSQVVPDMPSPVLLPHPPRPDVPTDTGAFERFFPDPARGAAPPTGALPSEAPSASPAARAADDLAEFSAWLKGLGNP